MNEITVETRIQDVKIEKLRFSTNYNPKFPAAITLRSSQISNIQIDSILI